MMLITVIGITLISYFHYNQLPIYNLNLAAKFIINEQKNNDFEYISKKLGYKSTDKLLIIHADDLGLCESVNSATFESFENGSISSASVMMTTQEISGVELFKSKNIKSGHQSTDIFILEGYNFKVVDTLITNFHLPESSLLMLVAAFAGKDNIMKAYNYAVQEKMRFFSYGDAMIIKPCLSKS